MKEGNRFVTIFWLCLLVLVMNILTAVMNWKTYSQREEIFLQVQELQERITALEESEPKPNTDK